MAMTGLDYLLILLLVLLPLLAGPVVQTIAGSSKTTRYRLMILALVVLGAGVVLAWITAGRPVEDLGLGASGSAGFLAAMGLVLLFLLYVAITLGRIDDPERAARTRNRLRPVAGMLPETRQELMWFVALGLVAGMAEELAYRGYLLLGLAPGGPWLALILSALAFGVAHLYQGWSGGASTALFGLGLGLVTLMAGSIIPAIVIHAAQDVATGLIAYRLAQPGRCLEGDDPYLMPGNPGS